MKNALSDINIDKRWLLYISFLLVSLCISIFLYLHVLGASVIIFLIWSATSFSLHHFAYLRLIQFLMYLV